MGLSDDLCDVLSSGGLGTTGTDLFKGIVPSTPDELTAVFETGGGPTIHAMSAGPGTAILERPHVQVLTRALRADSAKKRAQDAGRLLDALQRSVNGVRYHSVFALQSPFFLRRDEANRVEFSQNFEIVRFPASSS